MIQLPTLLLTANIAGVMKLCVEIEDSKDPVECDWHHVIVAEPMALCALAATLARMQRCGREVVLVGLSAEFKRHLERLDILVGSLHLAEKQRSDRHDSSLHTFRVKTENEGNEVGNRIADAIASLIPSASPMSTALEPAPKSPSFPLAYIFTELIDNGLRHGRGRGFTHASVWLSAQYHPPLGLIRLAVADDGCGFLSTFQGRADLQVKSHADAIRVGFRPFTSSKRDVGLFSDAQHQGLGLTICRDLAMRSDGNVSVVTGNAWITNPESPSEIPRLSPFWQGAIVSVELRLPAINNLNFFEITNRYNPDPNLPIRFV